MMAAFLVPFFFRVTVSQQLGSPFWYNLWKSAREHRGRTNDLWRMRTLTVDRRQERALGGSAGDESKEFTDGTHVIRQPGITTGREAQGTQTSLEQSRSKYGKPTGTLSWMEWNSRGGPEAALAGCAGV